MNVQFCIRIINILFILLQQISNPLKTYSQASRSRGGGGNATAQYPGVYPVTTMQTVAQAQPPPLVRATVHSSQPNLG